MNLKDILNKVTGTTRTGDNANTQVQSTSTETQVSNTEIKGTSTQHETTNSESNTIDKGKGKASEVDSSELDRDKARKDSNSESIVNTRDKGKGKASEDDSSDSYTWEFGDWDSSLHDKLTDNFNKIKETTNDVLEHQKKLASDLSPTEKSNLESEIQKYQKNMEKLSNISDRIENWVENNPDPYYEDHYPAEADKLTLDAENETIDKQRDSINSVDKILEYSKTKPFDSKPSKDLQEYKNSLEKWNELRKEREPIKKERYEEIEETMKTDNLRKREWEEIEQSENQENKDTLENDIPESSTQQSNKKAKTSLIDDFADTSTELPDYTGGDD